MIQTSESVKEIATALAKAQGEVENASRNANNPHFRSTYADLAEVLNTVRPVLAKHGLSVVQAPSFADGLATVDTLLMHSSGEWIRNAASAPVQKPDPQGVGSATTYLRRYSLAAMCGIAQEDDDAEHAVRSAPQRKQSPPKQAAPADDAATEKQTEFLAKLIRSRVFTDIERASVEKRLAAGLTKAKAKEAIDWAQECIDARKEQREDGAA
jgi:hypothetical protein